MRELLIPKVTTAMEVATLVRILPDVQEAADLIQQYANTVAAGAKIDATQEAYERMDAMMRDFVAPRPSKDEYAETISAVTTEMAE